MARSPVIDDVLPIFSDLHVRAENVATTLGVVAAMREVAAELKCSEVGFLGDFYHVRGLMPVTLQNAVIDELDRWAACGLRLIMIPGNHDQVDVVGRHALEALRSHPAVKLYERPTVDRWGLWVPYMPDLDSVRKALASERPQRRLFWHGSVLGAAMNDHVLADRGLQAEDFEGFDLVALGHFHRRQSFGHVHYVGSPWETRSDEAGQPKGYAIVRGTTLEYCDTAWGPRHHVVTGAATYDVIAALATAAPQDRVRVTVPEAQVESVSKALAGRFADYVVTPARAEVAGARALPGQHLSLRQHAERLVADRGGELDKGALMRAFEEFTQ